MKRILYIILFCLGGVFANAQIPADSSYPTKQALGNTPTTIVQGNAIRVNDGFINAAFTDTTTANLFSQGGKIKYYPGAVIFTTDSSRLWVRNAPANKWLQAGGSSTGGNITSFTMYTDSSIIICFSNGSCDTIPFNNFVTTINNIVNNLIDSSSNNVTFINDSTILICDGFGNCQVVDLGTTNNYYFLNDSTLVTCDTPQVIQVGDNFITQQLCDTITVPRQSLYIFQNGVRQSPSGIVEHGWINDGDSPGMLHHDTYLYTLYAKYNITGVPYLREVLGVEQGRVTWEGNSIQSFSHKGVNSLNNVKLRAAYTDTILGPTVGYVGDRIGYLAVTNANGSRYSMAYDNVSSKQSGLLYHTKDTANTDGVTIFATQTPLTMPFWDNPSQTTWYDKRIAVFHTDQSTNFLGKVYLTNGRLEPDTALITAANNLTLGLGNVNIVSGATTINAITTSGWQPGSSPVYLVFSGAPLVKNNTAGGAGTATILLAGLTDFQAAAGDVLALLYDGTNWRETNRTLASGTGITGITADNGITANTATNVQLGGTLIQNTTIDATANYKLTISKSGYNSGEPAVQVSNNSGNAFTAIGTAGFAITAQSDNLPLHGVNTVAAGANIANIFTLSRTTGAGVAGMGIDIQMNINNSSSVSTSSNRIISKWVTATAGAETSQLDITGSNVSSPNTIASFYGSGVVGIGISSSYTATRLNIVDNAVAGASIVDITSTSTAAASSLQKGLNISLSGANATAGQSTFGAYISNTHTGSSPNNYGLFATQSGDGYAIVGAATSSGGGVNGYSDSYVGGYFQSTSNAGVIGVSNSGHAGEFFSVPSSTATVISHSAFYRNTTGTAANGIGSSVDFYIKTDANNYQIANQLIWKWTTAADATRTSQLDITGSNVSSPNTIASFYGSGVVGIGISSSYTATRLNVVDNSLAGTIGVNITSTSTAAASGNQKLFNVDLSGANANPNEVSVAGYFSNTHTGTNAQNRAVQGITSGTSSITAYFTSTNGVGLFAQSSGGTYGAEIQATTGIGAYIHSDNGGVAITAQSNGNIASSVLSAMSSTNSVATVSEIIRGTLGTAAAGIGGSFDFQNEADNGTNYLSNQIISISTIAANATRTSTLKFTGVLSAATVDLLTLAADGSVKLRPITATAASAITPAEGMLVMVSSTDATFVTIGIWAYQNGAWKAL